MFNILPATSTRPASGKAWRAYLEAPSAASRRAAFWEGFAAPRYGLAYLRDNPQLWSYAIIPILLNVFITIVAFVLLLVAVGGFIYYLHPQFPTGWLGLLLETLSALALLLLAVLATFVLWFLLQGILGGYFYGKLARQVELRLGTPEELLTELPMYREALDTFRDVTSLILVNASLLLLHVVPVVGSIVSIAATAYFDCLLFGREYLAYPLSLRGQTRRQRNQFARQFRGQTIGLGAVVLLMTFVPILGSIVLTTAVVGAVLLHRRLAPLG